MAGVSGVSPASARSAPQNYATQHLNSPDDCSIIGTWVAGSRCPRMAEIFENSGLSKKRGRVIERGAPP